MSSKNENCLVTGSIVIIIIDIIFIIIVIIINIIIIFILNKLATMNPFG